MIGDPAEQVARLDRQIADDKARIKQLEIQAALDQVLIAEWKRTGCGPAENLQPRDRTGDCPLHRHGNRHPCPVMKRLELSFRITVMYELLDVLTTDVGDGVAS